MQRVKWAAKFSLGIANLFIGIVFFAGYGTEPIQKFFALPLYLICGILFLFEGWRYKDDIVESPNIIQTILLLLYLIYPIISMLLALLTIWGLTGIKSIIFNAYEDIILLTGGLYGIALLIREIRPFKTA